MSGTGGCKLPLGNIGFLEARELHTENERLRKEVKELSEENERLRNIIEDRVEVHIRKEREKKARYDLIKRIREIKIPPNVIDEIQQLSTPQPKINLEEATFIVKEVFAKIRGEPDMPGRRYIDCLGFDVIEAKEKEGVYSFVCEVGRSLFTREKDRYEVEISIYGELLRTDRREEKNVSP